MNWKATIGFTAATLGCIGIGYALVAINVLWGLWAFMLAWVGLVLGVGVLVGFLTRDARPKMVRQAHEGEK